VPIATINPATGETIRSFDAISESEIERRVALAAAEYPRWRALAMAERAARMIRAAELLEGHKQELGRLMTLEMDDTDKTYADLQVAEGYPSYFPASARILETPVRWVNQSGVSLCVRDMPVHLRVTPKVRRAA
jgi:succinate-semialdehyde dehydrogenase/glutarate-semialdehyde dehydrogenase